MADTENELKPPTDLLTDPARFWSLAAELPGQPVFEAVPPALKRLGPLPFPRGKFPLMGFLATVYEHVAAHVRGKPADPGIVDP
ncbi:MAG: hypothetical protein AAB385_05795 [Planctomycetota bacterium]